MLRLADCLFAEFRWYRWLRGGHRERWYIDSPVCSAMWLQQAHGARPGLGRGTPACEQWGKP